MRTCLKKPKEDMLQPEKRLVKKHNSLGFEPQDSLKASQAWWRVFTIPELGRRRRWILRVYLPVSLAYLVSIGPLKDGVSQKQIPMHLFIHMHPYPSHAHFLKIHQEERRKTEKGKQANIRINPGNDNCSHRTSTHARLDRSIKFKPHRKTNSSAVSCVSHCP